MVTLALEEARGPTGTSTSCCGGTGGPPQRDVAGRPHRAGHLLVPGPTGQPGPAVADGDAGRPLPRVCGYTVFLGAPSAMNTALALRQAIWPKTDPGWPMCGIPDVLYVDHGSDFTSHHLASSAADLHIRLIHSASPDPKAAARSNDSSAPSTPNCSPTLPGHLPRRRGRAGQRQPDPGRTGRRDRPVHRQDYNHRTHREPGSRAAGRWERRRVAAAAARQPRATGRAAADRAQAAQACTATASTSKGCATWRRPSPPSSGEPVIIRYDPRDITEIRVFHQRRVPVHRRRPGPRRRHDQPQGDPGRPQRPTPRPAPQHQRAASPWSPPTPADAPGQASPAAGRPARVDDSRYLQGGLSRERQRSSSPRNTAGSPSSPTPCAATHHRALLRPAGVGKTLSARRYAHWDQAARLLTDWGPRSDDDAKIYAALAKNRTVFYTPGRLTTPRLLREDLDRIITRTSICIAQHI